MSVSTVLDALACPICAGHLRQSGTSLRCPSRHSYDIAREGYVNLLPGRAKAHTADTAQMVAARRELLAGEAFGPLIRAVADASVSAVDDDVTGIVLDAGCGTGEYLQAVLAAMPERRGAGFDVSKLACRAAARLLPDAGFFVADTWREWPIRDRAAAVVLDVFAPRNAAETHRVLAREGALVVATPTALHLGALVSAVGLVTVDPLKTQRLSEKLGDLFTLEEEQVVTSELSLTPTEALAAVMMGPSAAHATAEEIAARLEPLGETIVALLSARVAVYRPIRRSA